MSTETLISILLGIPIGVISGLYSGLIVARYQRFADLRLQVLRVIREIEFTKEESRIDFPRRKGVPELVIVASDFLFLKHRRAGESTLQLASEIEEALYLASKGKIGYEVFHARYSGWQDAGRSLGPNPIPLLRLWSGL
jgi:hypothetical protein